MNILADTNILIDYLRGDKKIKGIFSSKALTIYYSILTKKELLGHRALSTQEKTKIMELLSFLRPIRIDPQIAEASSYLLHTYKKQLLAVPDAIIAATAWVKKMPLFTKNVKHFWFIKEIDMNVFEK